MIEIICVSCGCKAFVFDENTLYDMGWDQRLDNWFCASCLLEREGSLDYGEVE